MITCLTVIFMMFLFVVLATLAVQVALFVCLGILCYKTYQEYKACKASGTWTTKFKVECAALVVIALAIFGSGSSTEDTKQVENEPAVKQEQQIEEPKEEVKTEEPVEEYPNGVSEPGEGIDPEMWISGDEFSIEITKMKVKGNKINILYDYHNESSEEQTPITQVSIKCYQGGVELDTDYDKNYLDQDTILGGYSNEGLQEKCKLNGKGDTIIIKVEPWISFTDEVYAQFEYDINTDEIVRVK